MVDLLMGVCLQAGSELADPNQFRSVPTGSLADRTAREKLVKEVENQITADINAVFGMLIPSVVACVRADHSLTNAAASSFTTLAPDVAAGLAMRFYAGFLDMAKTLRENARQGPGLPDVNITPEQRGADMEGIHARAQQDEVYAAGVRFGPWGLDRRGERIFDKGISDAHKQLYLTEYYQQNQPTVGPTPTTTAAS